MSDTGFFLNLAMPNDSLDLNSLGKRVKNKVIFSCDDFIVMLVFGPNHRSDYHINATQVYYYIDYIIYFHLN